MIRLTGNITVEEGVFVSNCNELTISTCSSSLEGVMKDTLEMIDGYFHASKKAGLLEKDLKKLAAGMTVNASFDLETEFSLPEGLHCTSKSKIDLNKAA